MSSFIIINKENLRIVKEELSCGRGRILIIEPGQQDEMVNVRLNLYDHPLIEGDWLHTKRGRRKINNQTWQTDWQKDRSYLLRLRPKYSEDSMVNFCRLFFDRLIIGSYEFSIGFQESVSIWPFPEQGAVSIYIPKGRKIEPAFRYSFKRILSKTKETNSFLSQKSVMDKIIDYIKEDLRTRKTLLNNVSAGVQADIII